MESKNNKSKSTSEVLKAKREMARLLYLNGDTQKIIAEKVSVSTTTVNAWVAKDGWEELRAIKNVSRAEIVNKNLKLINLYLEKLTEGENLLEKSGSIVDRICKLAASIEKIDKKSNVITDMEAFTAFDKWLVDNMSIYPDDLKPDFVKSVSKYQRIYLEEKIKAK